MTFKPIDQIVRESGVADQTDLKYLTDGLGALDRNSDGRLDTFEVADENGFLVSIPVSGRWRGFGVGLVENALFKAGVVDSDVYARSLARELLTTMPVDQTDQKAWVGQKGDKLAAYLIWPIKPETKLKIAIALALSGRKDGADAVMSQVRQMCLDSENARENAVSKLREVAWNDLIRDALIALSAPEEKAETRRMSALALGGAHSEQSVGILSKLLDDPDFTVRINAARSLSDMAFKGIVSIEEPEREIGKIAGELLTERAVNGDVLATAVLARAEVWEKGMMPALTKAAQDKNPAIKEIASDGVLQLRAGDEITPDEAKALLGEEK